MNLFYNPTVQDLRRLLNEKLSTLTAHNIVVDYDGEVIVDPEFKYSGVPINRYKYRARFGTNCSLKLLLEDLLAGFRDNNRLISRQKKNQRTLA
jgi:hypothetical protein